MEKKDGGDGEWEIQHPIIYCDYKFMHYSISEYASHSDTGEVMVHRLPDLCIVMIFHS